MKQLVLCFEKTKQKTYLYFSGELLTRPVISNESMPCSEDSTKKTSRNGQLSEEQAIYTVPPEPTASPSTQRCPSKINTGFDCADE